MNLENAEFVEEHGRRAVALTIDGRPACLPLPEHEEIFAAGYVFAGPEWGAIWPPVKFSAPGVGPLELRGFSRDRRLWKLVEMLRRADQDNTFVPGPVAIPR